MYLKKIIILSILLNSFIYGEDMLGINITDTDIELSTSIEFNKVKPKKIYAKPHYIKPQHAKAIHLKPKPYYPPKPVYHKQKNTKYLFDAYYINTKGKNLFSLGVSGNNNFYTSEIVSFGVGLKSVFAEDFLGLPFYGKAMLTVPHRKGSAMPTVSISAVLAYAPAILSMLDGKEYKEFRGEADIEIIPKVHLFTGYRKIDIRYETFNRVFNDNVYGGMKFNF